MGRVMGHQLSVRALRRIDVACDSFEDDWRSGAQPRIEDFLLRCDVAERPYLLECLQQLQQELILSQLTGRSSGLHRPVSKPAPSRSPSMLHDPHSPDETIAWQAAKVTLRVVEGPHRGEEFVYDEHDTLLVGRSVQSQLRLKDDPHFSRHHFRLEVNPPACYLMDLSSRNGTLVNGKRISECFLADGDVISGGRTRIAVSISGKTAAPAAPAGPAAAHGAPGVGAHTPGTPQQPSVVPSPAASPQSAVAPANVAPAAPVAQRIPGYLIHEQIGDGDLGTVYRGTRLATGEPCALKLIEAGGNSSDKAVQTFLREISILQQLQHPHIIRMLESGTTGAELFLSMEYVSAIDWNQFVSRGSPVRRIRLACGLMSQILGALDYAHARSLVHRDVKPGNVLISRAGEKLVAKLADFGLAKQFSSAGMSQITRAGDVIGSLPWMSPEQFINSREARPASDLYSAGATLYWMLTGHTPINLENHPCKFLAILEDEPTPVQQHQPAIPDGLAQLVHRALQKTPESRFHSAAEMRQQLRSFMK